MKKFFMITPLQPVFPRDLLQCSVYEAIDNKKLDYQQPTRFPLMAVINGYAEVGEEIRVITITPETEPAQIHLGQLQKELLKLQEEKGFICKRGVESVSLTYSGNVENQIELFRKMLPYMENGDALYGCLTYGTKPMPMALLMAIQYAYRSLDNVSIECLVYGERDHSKNPAPMRIFDITALIKLDELVRMLAEKKVKNPQKIIEQIIDLGVTPDEKRE